MTMSKSMHPTVRRLIKEEQSVNQIVIIKIGGSVLNELPQSFYQQLLYILEMGWFPIIVHGGGPAITELLAKLGVKSSFVNGLRVTELETLEVVQMVLMGKENKEIVKNIQMAGGNAIGLSGIDQHMIKVEQLDKRLGFVGEIKSFTFPLLQHLITNKIIPIISPLGLDENGQIYNINADTVAQVIAIALHAKKMFLVSDIPGIYYEDNGKKDILHLLTPDTIHKLMEKKQFTGGMLPKVEAALQGLQQGIEEIFILNGREENVLIKAWEQQQVGTRILKSGVV